mgnify:CR=1 FL=1
MRLAVVLLSALALSACKTAATGYEIRHAVEFCKANGGVYQIRSLSLKTPKVFCNNGETTIIPNIYK